MRFFTFGITSFAVAVAVAIATPVTVEVDLTSVLDVDLAETNAFGAPLAPWMSGSRPGWYYGNHPERYPYLWCLKGWLCKLLWWFPHVIQCPKPPHFPPKPPTSDGYTQTFRNLTGATQASDYLTYGLVDTIKDCKTMCNSVSGCKFVNTYNDVNGKDGSTKLTCSLYTKCHTSSDATNTGGQTQPDGSVNFIRNSDGWCKK
ncbi:hypothetical protein Hypma_011385 [Hypsizygus marmoreus]|uniref:Apple domain-containing protein n=1 Tax=Hypsizygus marmoreus TaxID=39966 RepID=A0A369JLB1_HYPMA|nr:hypothetical protein Hypma_011385 [Hypsizygus marmoreus]